MPIFDICTKEKGVRVITVTENLDSFLAKEAECKPARPITTICRAQPQQLEEIEYTEEQFALFHSGGAVGLRPRGQSYD